VLGPNKTYFQCDALDAELIKYTDNAYLAVKVTFVNEMRNMADAIGADWHTVREGWLLDPRIERAHTAAFQDSPGFAGKCLPKDLAALIATACNHGHDPAFLRQVEASNDVRRRG
jgi:UDPglucose 6-dehydrogenase